MRRVRQTLTTLAPELGADRMVRQYVEELYRPAAEQAARVEAEADRGARELAAFGARVRAAWPNVQVVHVESGGVESPHVGDELNLRAYVELDGLSTDDVAVEVVYGRSRSDESIEGVRRTTLEPEASTDAAAKASGQRLYTGTVVLDRAGAFGYTVRVVPRHPLLVSPAELGLVAVAG